jgi:F-type H+-transporting ATPase subunit a
MHLPAILPWGAADGFSKQMLLVILSVVIIATFFVLAARKQQLVPGKLQFAGEAAYGFVRNSIAKDIIGGRDFIKYVPLLFSLFFFILVNNIYGAIPVIQLPSFSHVGGAYVLAGIVYFTWIAIGIKKNGLRYFKLATVPSGVPGLHPPDRHSDRDHLQLPGPPGHAQPASLRDHAGRPPDRHDRRLGIEYLVMQENVLLKGTSVLVLAGAIAMYMLEALIMALQAYVFTLLTAIYIEGALHADSH